MRGLALTLFSLISISLSAQSERKFIGEGNKLYEEKKYGDAEISYRKATDKKANSFEAAFNTANSLYKQGKYPQAVAMYDTLSKWGASKEKLSKVYYNLGNSYIKDNKIQEGIDAYKKSLKNNPNDKDTKYNLSYAYKLLKKQQEQQKNQDNKDKDKKDQDKKDNKDQQNKDKDKDKQDPKDNKNDQKRQNQQDQQQNQDQQKKQGQQDNKQQISPEAAKQMLEAIQNDEKNVQQRLQNEKKQKAEKVQVLKNW